MREELFKNCTLCPRKCNVNRLEGKRGYCGMDSTIRAARAALHMWEEPCISGKKGSGAVLSGCSLQCCFLEAGYCHWSFWKRNFSGAACIFSGIAGKRGGKSESGHWGALCAAYYFGVGAGQRKGNESSSRVQFQWV